MPINYRDYPPNWRSEIRPAILARAGNCCERCGVRNHAWGFRDERGVFHEVLSESYEIALAQATVEPRRDFQIVLTVAHLDHDRTNNDPSNLRALCQQCHLRHDAGDNARKAALTRARRAQEARRQAAAVVGQQELWHES